MRYKEILEGDVIQGPWGKKPEVTVTRSVYDQREAKPRPVAADSSVRFHPAARFSLGGWYYRHTDGQEYGPHLTHGEATMAQAHHKEKDEASKRDGKDYW